MGCRRKAWKWMLSLWCVVGVNAARCQGVAAYRAATPTAQPQALSFLPAPVPLDELTPEARAKVRAVLEHPTLSTRGPLEAFHCRPALYFWLLDRPDLAARLWRDLGAKCTGIQASGEGAFIWKDAQNGEVRWWTVLRTARQRVWYAEGRVKPGVMLPSVPVRAVVVLNHQQGADRDGKPAVRHQMDMILHTDSRAINLATRLFGASAPRMAREYVGQMEMFFGALAWYLTEHPDKTKSLIEGLKTPVRSGVSTSPASGGVRQAADNGTR